ncbi:MAG: chorismate synthase [Thermodesulfovibrionaceae bacterium]
MLRFLTAGESHGKALIGIIEGMPAGVTILKEEIDKELRRRQIGYGRGERMKIESDEVEILSGVRFGKTIGSPITLMIKNKDWQNWSKIMTSEPIKQDYPLVTRPRPGHADLAGAIKYLHKDIRNVLERSSARETAIRVAIGAVAKQFLSYFEVKFGSFVVRIGTAYKEIDTAFLKEEELINLSLLAEDSVVRCPWKDVERDMIKVIDTAKEKEDSVGGSFIVFATGVPIGLGSHVHWDRKLDSKIASSIMSIQAVKAVEIGDGVKLGSLYGSEAMDEIFYEDGFLRKTNHMGGIEGGISNGMPIVVKVTMKPIPTLRKPLRSVDIITKEAVLAAYERSDICAVASCSVIAEASLAWCLAETFSEKFGGDSIQEVLDNFNFYKKRLKEW